MCQVCVAHHNLTIQGSYKKIPSLKRKSQAEILLSQTWPLFLSVYAGYLSFTKKKYFQAS
jgi:hypothetical protein